MFVTIIVALLFAGRTMRTEGTYIPCGNQSSNDIYHKPEKNYELCRNQTNRSFCNITEEEVCNNRYDCAHGDDECFCDENDNTYLSSKCFRCLANRDFIVHSKALCDGAFDCPDLSDECLCMRKEWHPMCNHREWNITEFEVSETLECRKSKEKKTWEYVWKNWWKKTFINTCEDGGHRSSHLNMSLECQFSNKSSGVCKLFDNQLNDDLPDIYGVVNKVEEERRFFCASPETIFDFCCNMENFTEKTQYQFYNMTIPESKVCDKIFDCYDNSDECQQKCMGRFSSPKYMIKNEGFLAVAWIISLTALIGNLSVTWTSLRVPCRREKLSKEQKIIKMLFLSLAISDLLVSIYTFAICIAASLSASKSHRDDYCVYDREWRSSSKCTTLGVIFLIGSEQSVFTMVLIAFARVRAMRKPFSRPPIERIFITLVIVWIISILLAVIPLFPSLEDVFVTDTWYVNHQLFGPINEKQRKNITRSLLARFGNDTIEDGVGEIESWSLLQHLINKIQPYKNVTTFGFYSYHSVCLPPLFAVREHDPSWWYTTIITVINFLAFIAMLIGYLYIYKARKPTEHQVENTEGTKSISRRLQMKIMMILLTDFCCWMPVCVASFVRLTSEKKFEEILYLPTALIILPINSALNPFIYSGAPEYLWEKVCLLARMIHQTCCMPFITKFRKRREPDEIELS